ncbi:MAG TPA: hypothetical protein VM095_01205, partial [Pyrinomonadaceae bacterium]|nr:hypothetical protein [Pyrinomonadaceae bacterium]
TGELLDRFHFSPRTITIGIGIFFLIPGLLWFATRRWWNNGRGEDAEEPIEVHDPLPETIEAVR